MAVIALDVYGTLINPYAIVGALEAHVGTSAAEIAESWRAKQLEYSFRRAVMGAYEDFSVVTAEALDVAFAQAGVSVPEAARTEILSRYRQLDAFEDAASGLRRLQDAGHRSHAFSNGHPKDLAQLLGYAGLDLLLEGIVSVHEARTFKPSAKVYAHFNRIVGESPSHTCLVSSNPFDISGAAACGWKTIWVKRSQTSVFDAWDGPPTATISSLGETAGVLDCQWSQELGQESRRLRPLQRWELPRRRC